VSGTGVLKRFLNSRGKAIERIQSLILRGEFAQDSTPPKKKRQANQGGASAVQKIHARASRGSTHGFETNQGRKQV